MMLLIVRFRAFGCGKRWYETDLRSKSMKAYIVAMAIIIGLGGAFLARSFVVPAAMADNASAPSN